MGKVQFCGPILTDQCCFRRISRESSSRLSEDLYSSKPSKFHRKNINCKFARSRYFLVDILGVGNFPLARNESLIALHHARSFIPFARVSRCIPVSDVRSRRRYRDGDVDVCLILFPNNAHVSLLPASPSATSAVLEKPCERAPGKERRGKLTKYVRLRDRYRPRKYPRRQKSFFSSLYFLLARAQRPVL